MEESHYSILSTNLPERTPEEGAEKGILKANRAIRSVFKRLKRKQITLSEATAAKTEGWAMPTWCHMFNSTLTGNARVWFDKLPKESIDSYEDLRTAFRENYLQQTKHIKDPVEIHHIKQRDRESTEDFMERYKAEFLDVEGAPECMRISGFMHGITHPGLIKRLYERIPRSVDEMYRMTTSFLQGEVAALSHGRRKTGKMQTIIKVHTESRTHPLRPHTQSGDKNLLFKDPNNCHNLFGGVVGGGKWNAEMGENRPKSASELAVEDGLPRKKYLAQMASRPNTTNSWTAKPDKGHAPDISKTHGDNCSFRGEFDHSMSRGRKFLEHSYSWHANYPIIWKLGSHHHEIHPYDG
ncbi:reverse transcriptase domain-containing protein [Tanacetum coccineum]